MKMKLLFSFIKFCFLTSVSCTHFRGATFSWEPIGNGSIAVNFRVSWDMSFAFCNQTTIDNGTLIGNHDIVIGCMTGCRGRVGYLDFYCTDFSLDDHWSSGRNSISLTLPRNLTNVAIGYTGGNWIRAVGNGRWSLAMTIDSTIRSDTGEMNHSPTVDMPPLLRVQSNCSYTIKLPVFDVDGDTVRCRWATGRRECESVCNKFPNATLNETSCTIEYTPHWKSSMYVMALQIEDFATKDSVKPLSSIPLQVMVMIQNIGRCDQVPEFVGPTPKDDDCFPVEVGKPFVVTLKARSHTKLRSITTSSPIGMTRSPPVFSHVGSWHYITVNITWTPTVKDAGRDRSLCFYATDNSSVSSPLRCSKLPVPGAQKRRVDCGTEVDCGIPNDLRHGNATYNVTTVGSPATYICNEGYTIHGNSTVVCQQTGKWSATRARCTIKNCGTLHAPKDGSLNVRSTTYLSNATYKCNTGYEIHGSPSTTCQSDGHWSRPPPTCVIVDCGALILPNNGSVHSTSTVYMSNATYSCNSGYNIHGPAFTTCLASGNWSNHQPTCVVVDCGTLHAPKDGSLNVRSTTYLSNATYRCKTGYEIHGSPSTTCQSDGHWSRPPPTCVIVDCGALISPNNGSVHSTSTVYMSNATYSCNSGYNIHGPAFTTCFANGNWSNQQPTCVVVDCGTLNSPSYGHVNVRSTTYNSTAVYSCDVGYNMQGANSTKCLGDGRWSSRPPTCKIVDCGTPSSPGNGSVHHNTTTYQSRSVYACNNKFTLVGNSEVKCLATGNWNHPSPACKEKIYDCGPPDRPFHGNVTYTSTTAPSVCMYACDNGYKLNGPINATCLQTRKWSNAAPSCALIDCGRPSPIANGTVHASSTTFGSVITYTCDTGFNLIDGNQTSTCLNTEKWTGPSPRCSLKDCGAPSPPPNGNIHYNSTTIASVGVFNCDTGYELVGHNLTTCLSSGKWDSTTPKCTIKDCGPPSSVANGTVKAPTSTFRSIATYSCDAGFDLLGNNTSLCLAVGRWSVPVPRCLIQDCGIPAAPTHGQVHYNNTTFSSVISFTCDKGYIISGKNISRCLAGMKWSDPTPVCNLKDCGPPLSIGNGTVAAPSTKFGSVATYQCNTGYNLIPGNNTLICLSNGQWSAGSPSCIIVDCGLPSGIMNGSVKFTSPVYQGVRNYTCDPGFDLVGDDTSTCLASESWSHPEPTCTIKDCGIPDGPQKGSVEFTSTTYQSICTYTCTAGFDLIGMNTSECLASGQWDGEMPNCTEKACDPLDQPTGGEVQYSNTSHGSVAAYKCNIGQVLLGSSERKCELGIWTGDNPVCLGDSYTNTDDSLRGTNVMMLCIVACFLVAILLLVLIITIVVTMLRRPPPGLDKGTSTADQWTKCWDETYNHDVRDGTSDTTSLYEKQSTKGSNTLTRYIRSSRDIVPSPDFIADYKPKMEKQIFSITEVP